MNLLEGIRVLDLSQYLPGPYATRQLAELGADVIKVEPSDGDPMRRFAWQGDGISPVYQHLNQGKRIVELDLKQDGAKVRLASLIESAHVLIEGFRPGTLARLGFSNEYLHQLNPQLIICHLSGFGQTGRHAQRGGHDLGYSAFAGLYTQQAQARQGSGQPQIIFPPVADHAGALKAFGLISAALYSQAKTGQGAVLDLSLAGALSDWQYLFKAGSLSSLISGDAAYYNIYQCKDQLAVTLAAIEPKFWQAFCEGVNKPEWSSRQLESVPQTDLIEDVAALFLSQTRADWQQQLSEVDCCFEIITPLEEMHARAQGDGIELDSETTPLPEHQLADAEKIRWKTV